MGEKYYEKIDIYEEQLKEIELGEFDYILNIDLVAIQNNIANGIVTDLERDFIKANSNKKIDYFHALNLFYYIKSICATDKERGKELLKNKKLFQILDFYVNNVELFRRLKERITALETIKSNPEKTEELKKALCVKDDVLGVIEVIGETINDEYETVRLVKDYHIGTKKEITLSNMIESPCLGERYSEPGLKQYYHGFRRKLKFISFETAAKGHKQKIKNKELKLKLLKIKLDLTPKEFDKVGYIGSGEHYILITERELIELGLIPSEMKWEPLAINKMTLSNSDSYEYEVERFKRIRKINETQQKMAQYEISLRSVGNNEYKYSR